MELYKAKLDGAIFEDVDVSKYKSGNKFSRIIKKGELILVKKVEDLTEEKLSFPYKKYTLFNNKFAISLKQDGVEGYSKAGFADIPEHLFVQIKKPKVYITLGVILVGLAFLSIVNERKNN
jgi:hypothetical protein